MIPIPGVHDGYEPDDPKGKPMVAKYVITLYVSRAIDTDDDINAYMDFLAKRDLERQVLICLRRLDGDCDCEVMSATVGAE